MIVLNGVVQTPDTAFKIEGDSIVFADPPQPPASVKYVSVTINQIATVRLTFTNISGIFPTVGNSLVGTASTARLIVTKVEGNDIYGYITEGTFIPGIPSGELCTVGATGFSANLTGQFAVDNIGLFTYGETVTNLTGDIAKVEEVNLESGSETPLAKLRYTIGASTTSFEVISNTLTDDSPVPAGTFETSKKYQMGAEIFTVNSIANNTESTTLSVTRGIDGTSAVSQQEDIPIYGTDISVTNTLTLSKTGGGSLVVDTNSARVFDGNPAVKKVGSSNDNMSSGYSLYDGDDVKYWRYLGWESQNQRHVTRHQTNAVINTARPVFENVNSMLGHFNGILRYSNGKYELAVKKAAAEPSPVTVDGVSYTVEDITCLLYTSPSPRDVEESRMPSSA